MSELFQPSECTLFFSMIADESIDIPKLKSEFLEWEIWSEARFDFNPSLDYYSKEMGSKLNRWFWIAKTAKRDILVQAKLWAQKLEEKYSQDGARLVNCDPGIICLEHMVLATGKSYAHRVYLDSGIYAELCYVFEAGAFKSLQWTYPDYQSQEKINLFNLLRSRLFEIVRD